MNETIVSMQGICKSFPGVKALDNVHFELRSGEVMALLGENGAGKSTLMKILSGVYTRDSGTVEIFGKSYDDLTPKQAQQLGVAIIHQELNMCPHLNVAENMFLGREKMKGGLVDHRAMEAEAKRILDDLRISISPTETVGNLPVSKQQMVEIAKALSINARVLIMDEPTSALTAKEIDELFRIIRKLRDNGCGIVYISHRLEELQHIVDRVTIMRDGQYITSMNFKETTMDEIITNMVGREIKEQFPRVECQKGQKIFEVRNLNAGRMVRNINFELYAGEIVGFAGLMGAGRTEMAMTIFGAMEGKKTGTVTLFGEKVDIHSPADAISRGIALVTEDRKAQGLLLAQTVSDNIVLASLRKLCHMGVVDVNLQYFFAKQYVKEIGIKVPSLNAEVRSLSGGNQQKVVLAKWLMTEPKILILDEPTRGIDVGAKYEIYTIMMDLAAKGFSIIMISSELPEIMGMSDRVLVMHEGAVSGTVLHEDMTQERIMRLATGGNEDE